MQADLIVRSRQLLYQLRGILQGLLLGSLIGYRRQIGRRWVLGVPIRHCCLVCVLDVFPGIVCDRKITCIFVSPHCWSISVLLTAILLWIRL